MIEGKRKERERGRKDSERDGEERQKKNMKENQVSMRGGNDRIERPPCVGLVDTRLAYSSEKIIFISLHSISVL